MQLNTSQSLYVHLQHAGRRGTAHCCGRAALPGLAVPQAAPHVDAAHAWVSAPEEFARGAQRLPHLQSLRCVAMRFRWQPHSHAACRTDSRGKARVLVQEVEYVLSATHSDVHALDGLPGCRYLVWRTACGVKCSWKTETALSICMGGTCVSLYSALKRVPACKSGRPPSVVLLSQGPCWS